MLFRITGIPTCLPWYKIKYLKKWFANYGYTNMLAMV
jgi:hypothetical protein